MVWNLNCRRSPGAFSGGLKSEYYPYSGFPPACGNQDVPGRPSLAERLLAWLEEWEIRHLVADESGIGAELADWLAARLGRGNVMGFTFTGRSKAKLDSDFLSLVETGRFKYWRDDGRPLSDSWWFFT